MKTKDSTTPKRSKDLVHKNIEETGHLLTQVLVLESGTAGLDKYLKMLKLNTNVRREKFKPLLESMKKGEVLLTTSEKIYAAHDGQALLFKERNAFK